jgi:hypothetical protein
MTLSRVTERAKEVAKEPEPSKAWKNRWRVHHASRDQTTGDLCGPGIVWGVRVFPSKELAEHFASRCTSEYLGAFPIGPA